MKIVEKRSSKLKQCLLVYKLLTLFTNENKMSPRPKVIQCQLFNYLKNLKISLMSRFDSLCQEILNAKYVIIKNFQSGNQHLPTKVNIFENKFVSIRTSVRQKNLFNEI